MRIDSGNTKELKKITVSLAVIAAVLSILPVCRLYGTYPLFEFGSIALSFAAWIFIFFSLKRVNTKAPKAGSKESTRAFNKMRIASLCAAVFCVLGAGCALMAIMSLGRADENAFTDLKVMAFSYLALMAEFYVYHGLLKDLRTATASRVSENEKVPGCGGNGWVFFIIIILCLILIPAALLFSDRKIVFIMTVSAAVIMFISRFFMCSRILRYVKIHGSP